MAIIYTPSTTKAATGVFVSDEGEAEFLVEVMRRPQSCMYTAILNGKDYKRNSCEPLEIWLEIENLLGADLEIVPAKYLSKEFDIYKIGVSLAKEGRRNLRNRSKDSGQDDGHKELCRDLPWK